MTTPRTSAMKASVVPPGFRKSHGFCYHHISELVIASLTIFICVVVPAIAIPVPPGVGAGSAAFSPAGGPRRPGPSAMSRRPMQIAAAQPPGCQGVIAVKGRQHRR
jgi:hypothetical protein